MGSVVRRAGPGEIYIDIEGGSSGRLFTCGDIIKATVHLNSHQGLSIDHLVISFKCKAKSFISTGSGNNRRTHKEKVYLFCFQKRLVTRMVSFGQSHQTWDVTFQFPWKVLPDSSQLYFEENASFTDRAGYLPPPSWVLNEHNRQSIEYYLEAEMNKEGSLFSSHKKTFVNLLFSPPRYEEQPSPLPRLMSKYTQVVSKYLDPARANQHLSFREKTKQAFKSSDNPSATFTIRGLVPTVGVVGKIINITLGFRHELEKSTAPVSPEVLLSGIHVRLTAQSYYRVRYSALFGSKELTKDHGDKIDLVKKSFTPTPIYDGMVLNEIVPNMGIPSNLNPTFKTFNVNLSYIIKASITVICAQKEYEFNIARHAFFIYPKLHRQLLIDGENEPVEYGPMSLVPLGDTLPLPPGSIAQTRSQMPARRNSVDTLPQYRETDDLAPAPYTVQDPRKGQAP